MTPEESCRYLTRLREILHQLDPGLVCAIKERALKKPADK